MVNDSDMIPSPANGRGSESELITRDIQHIWHPCTQMKDFEKVPPLVVQSAQGCYLQTNKGPIIDAISSWWCKSLGHGHPKIRAAIEEQLARFEHVITANTTYESMVELAEILSQITHKQHVFFASDGATAVEIAMKLAIHAQQIRGFTQKSRFISLKNAYHGESLGTLGVSDLGLYKKPFQALMPDCYFIEDIPYVYTKEAILTQTCDDIWPQIETKLNKVADKTCAVLVEPLVQGAGGMLCYPADLLRKLRNWTQAQGIYLIADEIMTGIGRTGTWLASHHANVEPDLICLSKGLTSGFLPFSCVMIDKEIYDLFYADHGQGKSFLHSNTYSGNSLAVTAALATLQTMQEENTLQRVGELEISMRAYFQQVADNTQALEKVRGIGAIVAADLVGDREFANRIYQQALERGALIRPMGKTLYWLPPLNTDNAVLEKLADITCEAIKAARNCGSTSVGWALAQQRHQS